MRSIISIEYEVEPCCRIILGRFKAVVGMDQQVDVSTGLEVNEMEVLGRVALKLDIEMVTSWRWFVV